MTTRRGFLLGMLALGAAPAIVRAESLMRIWVPPQTLPIGRIEGFRFIESPALPDELTYYVDHGREAGDMTCIVTATEMNGRIIIVDRHWMPPHG